MDFAIGMKQSSQTGGTDGQRQAAGLTDQRSVQLRLRQIHHDALTQLQGVEIAAIATNGDLVIRTAISIVKDGARYTAPGKFAQIAKAVDDLH